MHRKSRKLLVRRGAQQLLPQARQKVAAQEHEGPAPAIADIGKAVERPPEPGKADKHKADQHQRFEERAAAAEEEQKQGQQDRRGHPDTQPVGAVGGYDGRGQNEIIGERIEQRDAALQAKAGVAEKDMQQREEYDACEHGPEQRSTGDTQSAAEESAPIAAEKEEQPEHDIQGRQQCQHVEIVKIARRGNGDGQRERDSSLVSKDTFHAEDQQREVDQGIEEIRMPGRIGDRPGAEGIGDRAGQNTVMLGVAELETERGERGAGQIQAQDDQGAVQDIRVAHRHGRREKIQGISDRIVVEGVENIAAFSDAEIPIGDHGKMTAGSAAQDAAQIPAEIGKGLDMLVPPVSVRNQGLASQEMPEENQRKKEQKYQAVGQEVPPSGGQVFRIVQR